MSDALIRRALESALDSWAQANDVGVQWQNVVLDPEPDTYIRAFLLPAPTAVPDVECQGRSYAGIWQLSMVLQQGVGMAQVHTWLASLASVYAPSAPLVAGSVTVRCLTPLSPAAPINEPGRFVVPCSLSYQATAY